MRRFFVPPEQMSQAEPVISGADAHHMRDVLRLRAGADVVVFDGRGNDFHARILSIEGNQVRLTLVKPIGDTREPRLPMALAQGLLKDKKMDLLVRQLTELGFSHWVPFQAKRSIPSPQPKRMEARYQRWQKISLEAVKQCGRSRAMTIDPVVSFAEMLAGAGPYDLKLIFWEDYASAIPLGRLDAGSPSSVFIMVGPEGGFSEEEVGRASHAGFRTVALGPRILRAETAAVAAGAIAQMIFGDMG